MIHDANVALFALVYVVILVRVGVNVTVVPVPVLEFFFGFNCNRKSKSKYLSTYVCRFFSNIFALDFTYDFPTR